MISLGFYFWKCLSPLFLTHTFPGYSALAWQLYLFIFWGNGHHILLIAFPDSVAPAKMSAIDRIGEAVIVDNLFYTAAFEIFLFVLLINIYILMCQGVHLSAFIIHGVHWASEMCNLIFFYQIWKEFSYYFFKYPFSLSCALCTPVENMLMSLVVFHISLK